MVLGAFPFFPLNISSTKLQIVKIGIVCWSFDNLPWQMLDGCVGWWWIQDGSGLKSVTECVVLPVEKWQRERSGLCRITLINHEVYRKKTDHPPNPYLGSPLGHQLSSKPEINLAKTASIDSDDDRKFSSWVTCKYLHHPATKSYWIVLYYYR